MHTLIEDAGNEILANPVERSNLCDINHSRFGSRECLWVALVHCIGLFSRMLYSLQERNAIVKAAVQTKSIKETHAVFAKKFPNGSIPAKSTIWD